MVITYRRPGVYLEESLLVNPADTAGTVTVGCFVGAAGKGPINDPFLCESWSSFVTTFGDFSPIPSPTPIDPNDVTGIAVTSPVPTTLAGLNSHATYGDGRYIGPDFGAGQYVSLAGPPPSKAHYALPAVNPGSAKTAITPGMRFAADPSVTSAADLIGAGYLAPSPATAWTAGQAFWIDNPASGTDFAYSWSGSAWVTATGAKANNGVWVTGAMSGSGEPIPPATPVLSYLPFAVYSFFQNGGRFAWIIRSVSTDPEKSGEYSSIDVNGASGTGDLQSFTLTARSVGSWGDTIKYQLVHNPPLINGEAVFSMRITVRNPRGVDETVENWSGLSINGIRGTKRIDAALNDATSGSQYVRVTNLNPMQPQPEETADSVSLSGGVDADVPLASDLQSSAIDGVPRLEGPINLNLCGYLSDANQVTGADPAAYWVGTTVAPSSFADRSDIMVINDSAPPRAPTVPSASYKNQMQSQAALGANPGDSYSASYGPWIIVPDPVNVGRTVAVPPGGAVMGMMARIDATVGVFRAPAGVIAGLNNAVGVQAKFTDTELGDLNAQNINVIRSVVGAGICVMGGRTRKSYGTDRYISARRTLIFIKEIMRRSTQFAVFENNDQRLWSALRMSAERVLRPLWEGGGLRGSSAAEAYYIRCDESLNTLAVISSGEVRMELGVALEYPAEFVIIRVTQFDQGTFTTEVQPAA